MNNKDLKTILSALHSFVLGSRPAYKDYLGEETIETPGVVVCEGELSDGEGYLNAVNPRKFAENETYLVTVGDETAEYKTQLRNKTYWLCNVAVETAGEMEDFWAVTCDNTRGNSMAVGTYVGQTITVSILPTSETRKRYDVRKLPEDCVPESVTEGIESAKKAASKAQSAANDANDNANDAWDEAYTARRKADAAQETADAAYRGYRDAGWLGDDIVGESNYIVPPQENPGWEKVSGGYRYPIKANKALEVGDFVTVFWGKNEFMSLTATVLNIQIENGGDVLETTTAIRWETKDVTENVTRYSYLTSEYYYTPHILGSYYWPLSVTLRSGTVCRKLPLTLSPYSAGDGINIDENGVISAENESAIVYVNITQSEGVYNADKTFAAITELYGAGNNVRAVYDDGTTKWLYDLVALTDQVISFQRPYGPSFERLIIRPDDSVTSDARGLVTASTQVNGHRLSEDITLTAEDVGATAAVLTSPNGTKYTITVDDEGVLHATQVEEATE